MAIKIEFDRICFGNFVFCEDANGVAFDGKACANEFCVGGGFQGEISGYNTTNSSNIEKIPFTSDTPATDIGELSQSRTIASGQSSAVSGYASGGSLSGTATNTIDKFPFATDTSATDAAELFQNQAYASGQSSKSQGFGYASGGYNPSITSLSSTIQKFPFAADAGGSDVGELSLGRRAFSGQSSTVSGYSAGGRFPSPSGAVNNIDKFPFSADAPASDVGDLSQSRGFTGTGQSSTVSGYVAGGLLGNNTTVAGTIDKFPFASDTNGANVGNLSQTRRNSSGQSSTVSGYSAGGGTTNSSSDVDTIDKFPFSSDTGASDVGEMTAAAGSNAGQQV